MSAIYVDHESELCLLQFLHKLSGFVHGAKVTFSVYWWQKARLQCGQTTWTGHVSGNTITARWVRTAKGFPTVSGTDTFTRKP